MLWSLSLALFFALTNGQDKFCPGEPWLEYQSHCYLFSITYLSYYDPRNFNESRTFCQAFNADILVVNDQDELSFLVQNLGKIGELNSWIGMVRKGDAQGDDISNYEWINGDPVDFTNFGKPSYKNYFLTGR